MTDVCKPPTTPPLPKPGRHHRPAQAARDAERMMAVETYAARLPIFYAPQDAAVALGVGEKTIYDLINMGRLRAIREMFDQQRWPGRGCGRRRGIRIRLGALTD
jgi:hypothetical protein